MKRVLVDTNIVLDLLAKREDFYREAQVLFSRAGEKTLALYVSALTFANVYYILSQQLKPGKVREILRQLKQFVRILPLNEKIIDLSLHSGFKDFEDAIQYKTATENRLEAIITRNLKDFKLSELPVFTAKQFLELNS